MMSWRPEDDDAIADMWVAAWNPWGQMSEAAKSTCDLGGRGEGGKFPNLMIESTLLRDRGAYI